MKELKEIREHLDKEIERLEQDNPQTDVGKKCIVRLFLNYLNSKIGSKRSILVVRNDN